jgi:uridine kinase
MRLEPMSLESINLESINLEHVLWLGGSPCAGKSTIAKHLAETFKLNLYHADNHFERHCKLATWEHPTLQHISHLTADELWLLPVVKQVERAVQLYYEEFDFVQADLRKFAHPVIAEGAALLPERVAPLLNASSRAIYLVPSEDFQRYHYDKRDWAKDVVAKTSKPAQAFENWMQRDARFALEVKRQALSLGLPVITIDGTESLEAIEARVLEQFNL